MPAGKKTNVSRHGKNARPWKFEEVPLGQIIEFEERTWTGTSCFRRELITGAGRSGLEVFVTFGGETLPADKLLDSSYALLRDGQRFPCGVLPLNDRLTALEKFKIARAFAKMICASWLFIREFEDDRLDSDTWIESAKHHKVLVGNTGRVRMVWSVPDEQEPDFSVEDMCRNSAVETAFHYLLRRFSLLDKYQGNAGKRAEAFDSEEMLLS